MAPAMLAPPMHSTTNGHDLSFPGQGSQSKGMGEGLFERFPHITEEASDILGYDIRHFVWRIQMKN